MINSFIPKFHCFELVTLFVFKDLETTVCMHPRKDVLSTQPYYVGMFGKPRGEIMHLIFYFYSFKIYLKTHITCSKYCGFLFGLEGFFFLLQYLQFFNELTFSLIIVYMIVIYSNYSHSYSFLSPAPPTIFFFLQIPSLHSCLFVLFCELHLTTSVCMGQKVKKKKLSYEALSMILVSFIFELI